MVYDDPLSQKSLQHAQHWPPRYWLEGNYKDTTFIDEELARKNFDLKTWMEYKKKIPNDGRSRPHRVPYVEFSLTEQELQAYKDDYTLCNPELCPKRWEEYAKDLDEVDKRFWWLVWQQHWINFGYPILPKIVWESPKITFEIFSELSYKLFIQKWGNPPDDFWIKLSYILEAENRSRIHRGLVLIFDSQGRIFPPPDLYEERNDPNPESLYLPSKFWK